MNERQLTDIEKILYERSRDWVKSAVEANASFGTRAGYAVGAATAMLAATSLQSIGDPDASLSLKIVATLAGLAYMANVAFATYIWRARLTASPGTTNVQHTVKTYLICETQQAWDKMMLDLEYVASLEKTANGRIAWAANLLTAGLISQSILLVVSVLTR